MASKNKPVRLTPEEAELIQAIRRTPAGVPGLKMILEQSAEMMEKQFPIPLNTPKYIRILLGNWEGCQ